MTPGLPTLGAPARRALAGAGIKELDDLTQRTEAELLALHGLGPASLTTLREALRERGLSFRQEKAKPS